MTYMTTGISFKAKLAAGVAMATIGLASAVLAEDAQPTELKPVVVQGSQTGKASAAQTETEKTGTAPVKGYVAKKTTTGSKTDIPLKDLPQSVSVVGSEEMSDRGVTDKVDEALRYTPGVNTQPFGSDPDTDWFYIRGFDASQEGMFLDGLTLHSFAFGNFQVDPFALERVEVLKGPASVLYGGSNPGGLVNMVRKQPTDQPYYYTEVGINSNGNAFTGFDFSDKLTADGVYSYRLTGKLAGGDGYVDHTNDLRGFVMPQLSISPDDSTKLTVYGYAGGMTEVESDNGFLPYVGTVVDAPFGKIDRKAMFSEPDDDKLRYSQQFYGYNFSHEFDNGWTLTSNTRYGHLNKSEHYAYTFGYTGGNPLSASYSDPDYLLTRVGFAEHSVVDTFSTDNRIQREFDTGPISHNFMVGADYSIYRLNEIQESAFPATSISASNPVYGATQPATSPYINHVLTLQQLGTYVQDQMRFGGGWLATFNGRYDFVTNKSDAIVGSSYDYNDKAASGRAGLAYDFGNGVTPYVSVGTFFLPQLGTNTSGGGLVPEKGEQYEAGIKYQPTFIDGLFTASLFQLDRKNVTTTGLVDGMTLSRQIGEVRSRGIEFEGKVNLDQNWKILGSYSYTNLEVTKDLDTSIIGNSPYLVPNSTAALWLDYSLTNGPLEGVSLGGGVRYQGKSWADQANTLRVPAATVFDAGVRYEKNGWGASLNVSNLFDHEYVAGCRGENVCGYGEGRTFTLKLSKKW